MDRLAEALRAPTADQAAMAYDGTSDGGDTRDADDALAVATALADQEADDAKKSETLRERETTLLKEMKKIAGAAEGLPDARVKKLIDWIRTELCPGGKWNNRRVLIFTEWTDTLRYLDEQLGAPSPTQIKATVGSTTSTARSATIAARNSSAASMRTRRRSLSAS